MRNEVGYLGWGDLRGLEAKGRRMNPSFNHRGGHGRFELGIDIVEIVLYKYFSDQRTQYVESLKP